MRDSGYFRLSGFLFGVADVGSEMFVLLVRLWMLVMVLEDAGEFHSFFGHY
jgi:hypothetical protein